MEIETTSSPSYSSSAWTFSACFLIADLVLTIMGTIHKNDQCSADNLGLAIMLALIATGVQWVGFLAFETPITIFRVIKEKEVAKKWAKVQRHLMFIPWLFALGTSIWVCIEVSHTSMDECSAVLYKVSLGYAITFYISAAIAAAILLIGCCCMCCVGAVALALPKD